MKPTTLWLDTETYSEADLEACGVYVYAAHPSTEVTLFTYALDDGPEKCWDVTTGGPMPEALRDAIADDDVIVVAHNAMFDRIVLRGAMGIDIPIRRWRCSMVKALCHALPAGLSELGKALGMSLEQSKLADGRKLVMKFCKPAPVNHKIRRYTRQTSTPEWMRFMGYATQDITAMRTAWKMIPNMNYTPAEVAHWHLDQEINDRGFYADRALAEAGASAAEVEKAHLTERLRALTNEVVDGPTKRAQLLAYVNGRFGLGLADMTKDTLEQVLKRGDLDPVCREILEVRLAANKTSTAKYAALEAALGADDRFRGGLQFAGAGRTRRWAGRIFQPQNLPSRGLPKPKLIDSYIHALKNGTHDLVFDDLMLYGAASLRGLVIAPPGKKLDVADLSNIEGRLLAWVTSEDWKLQAFRGYDAGTAPDLYNVTATSIIGGDPWKVAKGDRNVFGKVPDLSFGYRGGVAGAQTFCHAYGVRMEDHWPSIQANIAPEHVARAEGNVNEPWARKQITSLGITDLEWVASETVKLAWRARHPATAEFWKKIEWAAMKAIENPETAFSVRDFPKAEHQALDIVAFAKETAGHLWLYIKLPSGKFLTYFEPRISDGEYGKSITYMSLASEEGGTSRAWIRTYTHGGKFTGNICQTLAGDLLKDAMPAIEAAGYQTVLTVHDEVVTEAPDSNDYSAAELTRLLATNPSWAAGLPLSAAGFETDRYKKD